MNNVISPPTEKVMYEEKIAGLIEACNKKGWRIAYHSHPKTKANWDNWRKTR